MDLESIIENDLLRSSDQGLVSVLVSLDRSAAFDTSDHCILMERLERLVETCELANRILVRKVLFLEGMSSEDTAYTQNTQNTPQMNVLK